jgi:hypothetical protein
VKEEVKSFLASLGERTFNEQSEQHQDSQEFKDELPGGAQDEDPDEDSSLGNI